MALQKIIAGRSLLLVYFLQQDSFKNLIQFKWCQQMNWNWVETNFEKDYLKYFPENSGYDTNQLITSMLCDVAKREITQ